MRFASLTGFKFGLLKLNSLILSWEMKIVKKIKHDYYALGNLFMKQSGNFSGN